MESTLQVGPLYLYLPTLSKRRSWSTRDHGVSMTLDQVRSKLFGALQHSQTNELEFLQREFDLFQQANQHEHRRKLIANIVNQR